MILLQRWISLWLLLSCSSLQAGKAADYQALIHQESVSSGVPEAIITAVIQVESSFRKKALSPKGAQGLMQLMPATAQRFGVKNAFDPKQNIRGGTQYLLWLYRRYQNWPLVLAAYNAGEQKVDKYGGIPPYRETRNYVGKVLREYARLVGQPAPAIAQTPHPVSSNTLATNGNRVVSAVLRREGQGSVPAPLSSAPIRQAQTLENAARASSVFFAE